MAHGFANTVCLRDSWRGFGFCRKGVRSANLPGAKHGDGRKSAGPTLDFAFPLFCEMGLKRRFRRKLLLTQQLFANKTHGRFGAVFQLEIRVPRRFHTPVDGTDADWQTCVACGGGRDWSGPKRACARQSLGKGEMKPVCLDYG